MVRLAQCAAGAGRSELTLCANVVARSAAARRSGINCQMDSSWTQLRLAEKVAPCIVMLACRVTIGARSSGVRVTCIASVTIRFSGRHRAGADPDGIDHRLRRAAESTKRSRRRDRKRATTARRAARRSRRRRLTTAFASADRCDPRMHRRPRLAANPRRRLRRPTPWRARSRRSNCSNARRSRPAVTKTLNIRPAVAPAAGTRARRSVLRSRTRAARR